MTPHTPEEFADYWAVRLEGSALTDTERSALESWLAAEPTHRPLLSASCQFLADLERQLSQLVPADAAEITATEVDTPPVRSRRGGWRTAGFAAAAVVAVAVWFTRPTSPKQEVILGATRVQSIALADGTRADLNRRTHLRVDFSDEGQRLVKMDRGEAMFTVAKNDRRPFIVETPGGRVRVTGTVFNVRADTTGQLEVTVIEGAVEVTPAQTAAANGPLQLGRGDQVTIDAGSLTVKRLEPEVAVDVTAWRENRVVFDGVPLGEAVRRFRTYGERRFEFAPDVAELRVGGRYSLDDLDGLLKGNWIFRGIGSGRGLPSRRPGGTLDVSGVKGGQFRARAGRGSEGVARTRFHATAWSESKMNRQSREARQTLPTFLIFPADVSRL